MSYQQTSVYQGGQDDKVPSQIYLQPIAAPSILGLFGFAGATFIVATNLAGWYGDSSSPTLLFPFAAMFGGLAQFMAGMWAFKARDGLATAMHGMWGAFWMAYGILFLLGATGAVTIPTGRFPELGYWFIVLAAVTWMGTAAALAENVALTGVLAFLAAGSTVAAIAFLAGNGPLLMVAGWLFIISAVIAWYTASAMMLEDRFHQVVLSVGKFHTAAEEPPVVRGLGEPGVVQGQ